MEELRKKEEKMSLEQKEIMVTFMEENLDFARGRLQTPDGRITTKNLWLVLVEQLNSHGKVKSTQQWQRTWTDIKIKVKRKVSAINNSRSKTGGGPMTDIKITDFDDRIMKIISEEAVFGIPEIDVSLESDKPQKATQENVAVAGPSGTPKPIKNVPDWTSFMETEEGALKRKNIPVPSRITLSESEVDDMPSPTPRKIHRSSAAATAVNDLKSLSAETNSIVIGLKNEVSTLNETMKLILQQNHEQSLQRQQTNLLLERIAKALEGQSVDP